MKEVKIRVGTDTGWSEKKQVDVVFFSLYGKKWSHNSKNGLEKFLLEEVSFQLVGKLSQTSAVSITYYYLHNPQMCGSLYLRHPVTNFKNFTIALVACCRASTLCKRE